MDLSEERIKQMEESSIKRLIELSEQHSDVKCLLDSYKDLKLQERWSDEFLDGYLSCLTDFALFVKKMN